ncbi:hypothetical protein W97_02874 [Coniosporium apollinis CBS 100218]|uniref:Uncharacterized protein n=1 Tax=Coniosporium apollinis (strain CBS 100218) TaxID=1168221 RepID=R7YPT0_CONA1|nr:uncharacterized protein W97_02874 [Coniosporium apollinis CBS 100218]EON63646.1 hypothetical protein W97_02874 [Coniosporium apollinis CBS 100218]
MLAASAAQIIPRICCPRTHFFKRWDEHLYDTAHLYPITPPPTSTVFRPPPPPPTPPQSPPHPATLTPLPAAVTPPPDGEALPSRHQDRMTTWKATLRTG